MRSQNKQTKLRRFAIACLLVATFILVPFIGLYHLILSNADQIRSSSIFVSNIIYRDEEYWCLKCTGEGKRLGLSITLKSFDVEPIKGLRFQCFRAERLIDTGMMEMSGSRKYLDGACSGPLQTPVNHINAAYEEEHKYSAVYGILVSPHSDKVLVAWSDDIVHLVKVNNGPFRTYVEEQNLIYDGKRSFLTVRRDCPPETYVSHVDVLDKNGNVVFSYSP